LQGRQIALVALIYLIIGGAQPAEAQVLVQGPDPAGSTDSIFDNRGSSLIRTGHDSLLIVWFGGVVEGATDNVIYSKRSFDAGKT